MIKKTILSTVAALGVGFNVQADIPQNIAELGALQIGGADLSGFGATLYVILSTVPNGGALDSGVLPGGALAGDGDETIQLAYAAPASTTGGSTRIIDFSGGDDLPVNGGTVDLVARVFAATDAADVIAGTPYLTRIYPDPPESTDVPAPTPLAISWSVATGTPVDMLDPGASGAPSTAGNVVPEPGVLALLGIGALTLWLRRRD